MTSRAVALFKSWAWALVPLWTIGIGTGAIMAHAAVKKRSLWQALTVPFYFASLVLLFAADPDYGGVQEVLFGTAMGLNIGGGLMHAVAIRGWVFADSLRPNDRLVDRQRLAVAAVRQQAEARRTARELLAAQPDVARELLIGRPDVPNRQYPDGGLVDVNKVPAEVLGGHLSLKPEVARHIVAIRDRVGGFSSYDDMLLLTNVDPGQTNPVSDLMAFGVH
ncbi:MULTISPECIES: hypothetical protein [unclassified Nocardioides]|uniref:hypothetical protein n=1 Tax=unclassified Nocardioides TaxID=2615069 RepID=UPI0006FB6B61|nr:MULTISPECIES: hypothetical protein [unclassified Nocardioides]KQY64620.1 hypothetical protein ASD30_06835 [Nocardioides sp. Root140]KRF12524.1 hypothetical protein ASH02_13190 [Nocardioides sp. Soil796]